jgi:hypothetical protein
MRRCLFSIKLLQFNIDHFTNLIISGYKIMIWNHVKLIKSLVFRSQVIILENPGYYKNIYTYKVQSKTQKKQPLPFKHCLTRTSERTQSKKGFKVVPAPFEIKYLWTEIHKCLSLVPNWFGAGSTWYRKQVLVWLGFFNLLFKWYI